MPVLLYHRFADAASGPTAVSVKEFEAQMMLIKKEGYSVIPLRQLLDAYNGKGPFPPAGSVVITVDDGHRSFYDKAFGKLRELNYPAALFIHGRDINMSPAALNWAQLAELQRHGMEIQSHTFSHPNLKKKAKVLKASSYETFVDAELEISKRVLENYLGTDVSAVSYPYGVTNGTTPEKLTQHGYTSAFTTDPRPNYPGDNPFHLGRFTIRGGMSTNEFRRILRTSRPHGFEPEAPVNFVSAQQQP